MRIISAFKDYYDGVQRHVYNEYPQYIRETREIRGRWEFPTLPRRTIMRTNFTPYIIGFCGEIYPMIQTVHFNGNETVREFCYNIDNVDNAVKSILVKHSDYQDYILGKTWNKTAFSKTRRHIINWFGECNQLKNCTHLFNIPNLEHIHIHSPVFIVKASRFLNMNDETSIKFTYNPPLSPMKFYRIFDSYSAYQELSMYLGGLASLEKPIPGIADGDMIVAKGFNKYSFKQEKGVHKRGKSKREG